MEEYIIHMNALERNDHHAQIEAAIEEFSQLDGEADIDDVIKVLETVRHAINAKVEVIVPVELEPEQAEIVAEPSVWKTDIRHLLFLRAMKRWMPAHQRLRLPSNWKNFSSKL